MTHLQLQSLQWISAANNDPNDDEGKYTSYGGGLWPCGEVVSGMLISEAQCSIPIEAVGFEESRGLVVVVVPSS